MANRGRLAHKDRRERKAIRVKTANRGRLARKARRERKAIRVKMANLVDQAPPVRHSHPLNHAALSAL